MVGKKAKLWPQKHLQMASQSPRTGVIGIVSFIILLSCLLLLCLLLRAPCINELTFLKIIFLYIDVIVFHHKESLFYRGENLPTMFQCTKITHIHLEITAQAFDFKVNKNVFNMLYGQASLGPTREQKIS